MDYQMPENNKKRKRNTPNQDREEVQSQSDVKKSVVPT